MIIKKPIIVRITNLLLNLEDNNRWWMARHLKCTVNRRQGKFIHQDSNIHLKTMDSSRHHKTMDSSHHHKTMDSRLLKTLIDQFQI